ncbi:MAG: hypothetical protein HW419_3910 [Deltaproteobacteria bacterium]|nr:hypothetical protein [Deltaproteobacteria bacterium]
MSRLTPDPDGVAGRNRLWVLGQLFFEQFQFIDGAFYGSRSIVGLHDNWCHPFRISTVKTANAKDFVDSRFIEELDKSGYIDGLYKKSSCENSRTENRARLCFPKDESIWQCYPV